ncbi:MAG TPA: replication-relaxation family protein [Actinocatenispora sp.]
MFPTRLTASNPSLRLSRSLTPRDRYLLALLGDHQVLTTVQVSQAWGAPMRRTQARLTRLLAYGVVDRFRPYADHGGGSMPYHWVLGPLGAIEAAARDTTPSALGWNPQRVGLAASSQLALRRLRRMGRT